LTSLERLDIATKERDKLRKLFEIRHDQVIKEELIHYLKLRWRNYSEYSVEGISRHTFALPKDWEQALRKN